MLMDVSQARRKSKRLMNRHPGHLPVIIVTEMKMTKYKFLPHEESNLGMLLSVIRNYTDIKSTQAFIVTINKTLPPLTALIGDLYKEHATPDGYLHICVSKESTFG